MARTVLAVRGQSQLFCATYCCRGHRMAKGRPLCVPVRVQFLAMEASLQPWELRRSTITATSVVPVECAAIATTFASCAIRTNQVRCTGRWYELAAGTCHIACKAFFCREIRDEQAHSHDHLPNGATARKPEHDAYVLTRPRERQLLVRAIRQRGTSNRL
jgi:hypothetical protein